jgi:hypothetical protein
LIELDILGRTVRVPISAVERLRDLAVGRAGRSSSARDLSLVLDRACHSRTKVALQRGEVRVLLELLQAATDEELIAVANSVQTSAGTHMLAR